MNNLNNNTKNIYNNYKGILCGGDNESRTSNTDKTARFIRCSRAKVSEFLFVTLIATLSQLSYGKQRNKTANTPHNTHSHTQQQRQQQAPPPRMSSTLRRTPSGRHAWYSQEGVDTHAYTPPSTNWEQL